MSLTFYFNGNSITMKNTDTFGDLHDNSMRGSFVEKEWTLNGAVLKVSKATKLGQFLTNNCIVTCQVCFQMYCKQGKIRFVTEAPTSNNFQNQQQNQFFQQPQPVNNFPPQVFQQQNTVVQQPAFQQSGNVFDTNFCNQQYQSQQVQQQQQQQVQFQARAQTQAPFIQQQFQAPKQVDQNDIFATENLNKQHQLNQSIQSFGQQPQFPIQPQQPIIPFQQQPPQANNTDDIFATANLNKQNELEYEPKRLAYLQGQSKGDKYIVKEEQGFKFEIDDYGKTIRIQSANIQLTITEQFSVQRQDAKTVQEKLQKSLNFYITSLNYTRLFYLKSDDLLVIQWQTGKIITLEFNMSPAK